MDGQPLARDAAGVLPLNGREDALPPRPERLELHLTYTCTASCAFCSEEGRMRAYRRAPVDARLVRDVLRAWVPRGVRHVHFTGGEPTLHPELPALLALCKRGGLKTSMGTNGHRLADPAYAARVVPHLDEVIVSLHGPDAATHEGLTHATGGFARAVAAIRAFPRPGVNVVVTRDTLGCVAETVRLAVSLGAGMVLVSAVSPEGAAAERYTALAVRLADVSAMCRSAVEAVGDVPVRFFGLPACALGDARARSNDLFWSPRVTVEWTGDPDKPQLDAIVSGRPDRGRGHVSACVGCAWAGVCPGPFVRYVEAFGDAEIAPFTTS